MTRDAWSDPVRFPPYKTERECLNCGIIKVTRHEIDSIGRTTYWTEWWRGMDQIQSQNTPVCIAEGESVMAR